MNDRPKNHVRDSKAPYTPTAHFGRRLQTLRETRGLSLEEFSHRSGIAAVTLEEIEAAMQIPATRTLERLCLGLAIPLALLLRD